MDWTALLAAEDENPRSRLVTELLASDAYGSMESRAAAFVRQGGGCRATFFNYRRKIGGLYSLGSDRFILFVYSLGRVDLGGCPPRSPTDPGLHITRTRFLIS